MMTFRSPSSKFSRGGGGKIFEKPGNSSSNLHDSLDIESIKSEHQDKSKEKVLHPHKRSAFCRVVYLGQQQFANQITTEKEPHNLMMFQGMITSPSSVCHQ